MDQTLLTSCKRENAGPTTVSLFSGAMGLDLGLERAGFQTRVAVESDPDAVATVRANRPGVHVFDRPIEDVSTEDILRMARLGVGELDLVAGGPACQSFSTAGKRRSLDDPLGQLFYKFMRVVEEARPRFFLMENVRGLLSAAVRHRPLAERGGEHPPLKDDEELGSAFEKLTARLKESGYYVVFDVLNAADFGVAQTRQRLVILGSRDGVQLSMPAPTHCAEPVPGLSSWKTLREALQGFHEDEPEYIEFVPSRRAYFRSVPAGGNWRDLPDLTRSQALGSAGDSWGGRTGFFRRLSWDAPSPTLNTNPDYKATALCHPEETRPLSVGEYARIQGFPDDWTVNGSTRAKYRQLGNAVPVELAAALGRAVRAAFGRRRSPSRRGRVECWNLDLLNSLCARHRTRFNPPRIRGEETRETMAEWRGDKGPLRDDAARYTPTHLSGAVGKKKKVATILTRLRDAYGSPNLGNYSDPVDELFFIILSQRTTGASYERVFRELKEIVSDWDTLPEKGVPWTQEVISRAGLSNQKAKHIVGVARRLRSEFGRVTLEPLRNKPDAEIQEFLTSLPGVGVKTAKCVMLFSMGRRVLPVDAHVARVAERLGLVNSSASKTRTHEVLEAVVPSASRYDFHVNLVAHGRALCRAREPVCEDCRIRSHCNHWVGL